MKMETTCQVTRRITDDYGAARMPSAPEMASAVVNRCAAAYAAWNVPIVSSSTFELLHATISWEMNREAVSSGG